MNSKPMSDERPEFEVTFEVHAVIDHQDYVQQIAIELADTEYVTSVIHIPQPPTEGKSDEEAVCRWCGKPINSAPDSPSGWIHETWAQRSKCGHYAEPLNPQPPTGEGVEGEFEAWWALRYSSSFEVMPGIMQMGFREIAHAAWNAARKGIK